MGGVVKGIGNAVGGLAKTVGGFVGDPLGHGSIEAGMGAQANATNQANATLERMYKQQRQDIEPWQKSGLAALGKMENPDFQRDFTAADFQQDPGYEFRMAEGQKAIERSAAAKGGLRGGGSLKALSRYGQDFASNEYGNAYNRFNADRDRRFGRLSNIAGMGQNAVGQLVNAGQNYGMSLSGNQTGLGNAYAAGNVAKANSNQKMVEGLISLAGPKK